MRVDGIDEVDETEWLRHEVQQLRSTLYAAHTFPDWERTRRDRVAMWFQRHWLLWSFAGVAAGVGIGMQL